MLIFAACMVTVDVLVRKAFSMSMGGADEVTGYIFAISTAWALSYALLGRANVRIDAFYQLLPRRLGAVLDSLGLLVLGGFMTLVTLAAYTVFYGSLGWPFGESDFWSVSITPLLTPLALPQGLWFLGLVLFMVTLVLVLLRAVLALARGDLATVARLAGPRSHQEEVEEELHSVEAAQAEAAQAEAERGQSGSRDQAEDR